ncbi:MAG: hypothetical protein NZ772_05335 [Cyanobacteria bacterium]|nr:hypothetical protein [Cyanobacteriota bacterium]MDW8200909.1 hypothetical protein [Cyanobacteriota bacterium SKYGB_h_bin112]
MLYFLLAWVILVVVCEIIGTAALTSLQVGLASISTDCGERPTVPGADSLSNPKVSGNSQVSDAQVGFARIGDRGIAALWLGLIILAVSLQATALVVPLSPVVGGLVTAGLVALALRSPHNRNQLLALKQHLSIRRLALGVGIATVLAALTTHPVTWIDTGLYHYGSIQWLANYGTVPGVALLFSHYGFGSSWFALAAPFNPPVLGARAAAIANGFVVLSAVLSLWVGLHHCSRPKAQLSDWFLVLYLAMILTLTLVYSLFSVILISASPDLPVMVLVGLTAWAMVVCLQSPTSSTANPAIPLLLAAGAMTMKLVAIPLVVIASCFWLGQGQFTWRRSLLGIALLSLIIAPMLASNIITSGCPLYPSNLLCLELPWSPASDYAKAVAESTHSVTKWFQGQNAPTTLQSWLWAMWAWFRQSPVHKLIGIGSISWLVLALSVLWWLDPQIRRICLWLSGTALGCLLFLFRTSPMPRFTIPYLVLMGALFLALGFHQWIGRYFLGWCQKTAQVSARYSQQLTLATYGSIGMVTISIGITAAPRLWLPPPMQQSPIVQKTTNDIIYWSPKPMSSDQSALCWSAPLPCAFEIEPDVWLRNPTRGIAAGFVRKPGSDRSRSQ